MKRLICLIIMLLSLLLSYSYIYACRKKPKNAQHYFLFFDRHFCNDLDLVRVDIDYYYYGQYYLETARFLNSRQIQPFVPDYSIWGVPYASLSQRTLLQNNNDPWYLIKFFKAGTYRKYYAYYNVNFNEMLAEGLAYQNGRKTYFWVNAYCPPTN